jgi:cyanophycinase
MVQRTPGPLILVGGAEFGPGNEPHDRLWAAAAGARPALIVATAAVRQDPDRAVATAHRWFATLGVEVAELRVRGRRDAASAEVVDLASQAGAFYLCGGDPGLVVSILSGSDAWEAIADAWRSGAALAGSSAGAMALGRWSLIRAGVPHDRRRFAPALDLLPNVAVVPHLDEFGERWIPRLRLPSREGVLLGLDTRTAAVWRPAIGWRASGAGRVAVVDDTGRLERSDGGRPTGIGRPRTSRPRIRRA